MPTMRAPTVAKLAVSLGVSHSCLFYDCRSAFVLDVNMIRIPVDKSAKHLIALFQQTKRNISLRLRAARLDGNSDCHTKGCCCNRIYQGITPEAVTTVTASSHLALAPGRR